MTKTLVDPYPATPAGVRRPAHRLLRRSRPTVATSPGLAAAAAYAEFGQSLYLFACVLTEDIKQAEQLVIQAFLAHQRGTCTLQELAASAYVAWAAAGNPTLSVRTCPFPGAAPSTLILHEVHGLPADQRAALGLCKYGDHTYRQAAEVLGLPPERVAQLLCDALRGLGIPRLLPASPASAA